MASESTKLWKNLESIWGVDMETEQFGAIWIAKKGQNGENKAWKELSKRMKSLNIEFNEIDHSKASELCGESLIINEDESYYYEPAALQIDPSILRSTIYDALEYNGVEILEKTSVESILTNDNNVTTCVTNNGNFSGKNFVNAVGAWSLSLIHI